jgi:HAD superfamily hydrolase (TIGR01549 family)
MTPLESLLAEVDVVFFDFDGPVCGLFSGYPATRIADQSREVLKREDVDLPVSLLQTSDPLEVLRWAGSHRPELLAAVEAAQSAGELVAVKSASPAVGGHEAMRAAAQSGRPVAIVSNNSVQAIDAYLSAHGLAGLVTGVIGRISTRSDKLKPDPDPLNRAAAFLDVAVESCVLIGDSTTDIEAALKAGSRSVGYAKNVDRISALEEAGADVVVDSMQTLEQAFLSVSQG